MLAIEYFDKAVALCPDRVAVTDGPTSHTFGEISSIASGVARALVAGGAAPGTRIAILSPNHPLVLACQYGILRAGCVWVPTNFRNPVSDTLAQIVTFDVKWIFHHSSLQADVDAIRREACGLDGVVVLDGEPSGATGLRSWVDAAPATVELPSMSMDDVIYLGSTGGTTGGGMKGVVHTNRSWEINIANSYSLFHFEAPVVHLVVAPLTHAAGVFHWTLVGRGATHVLCPSADPRTILAMVAEHRATFMFLPPTVMYMLLSYAGRADHDLTSLEYITIGAAPMSVDKLDEAVEAFGPIVCQAYGSTETLLMNMFLSREELAAAAREPALRHRLASVGREGPLLRVAIMADDGSLLPSGERGEIVMQSGMIMREYHQDEERTALTRMHGWHHTGDIGWRDAEGYVYLVDRKNDMIITGGFNVYPGEIEQVVLSHPAVQDCAVVGVPHDKWGEMVLAAIQLKPGATVKEDQIIAFCRDRLGGVRAPKVIEILDELPRSPVGKTLRRAVRARHWAQHARKI